MSSEAWSELIRVDLVGGVPVVRFCRRTILDPLAVEAVGERLVGLVRDGGHHQMVLDFSRVESLTSAMFSKFMLLQQAVEAVDGQVVFCQVDPFLRQIFEVCRLPKSIAIYGDEAAALAGLRQCAQGQTTSSSSTAGLPSQ